MELTKEQVRYIDNRLKNKGITYWDMRLEMLDHVVTSIENKNVEEKEFRQAVELTFTELGWNGNLTGVNRRMCKAVNKKSRKMYGKEILGFFKSGKRFLLLLAFLLLENYLGNSLSLESFTELNYQFFFLPMLVIVYYGLLNLKNKVGRSIHHIQGFFYMILSFLVLNALMLIIVARNSFSLNTSGMIIATAALISLHFIFSYAGIKVYRKALTHVLEMKKAIKTL